MKLQIGTIEREYSLFETHASRSYDGFGTIEIESSEYEGKVKRWVLIDAQHQEWQTQRYGSGMHSATPVENFDFHAQQVLMKRLAEPED